MKLILTKLTDFAEGAVASDAIKLERNGSDFIAPVTLKLRTQTDTLPAVSSQSRVKLTSACESTKNGTRRALMRSAIPYIGLFPANSQDGSSVSAVSAARSGKEISFHTVMTVPRECYDDIVNQKAGSEGYKLAVTQVLGALKLHLAAIGDGTGRIMCTTGTPESALGIVGYSHNPGVKFDEATNTLSEEGVYDGLREGREEVTEFPMNIADQPWLRALSGLKPLADDAEVGVRCELTED